MTVADERRVYGLAECLSGRAKTMSGTAALVVLLALALRTRVHGRGRSGVSIAGGVLIAAAAVLLGSVGWAGRLGGRAAVKRRG